MKTEKKLLEKESTNSSYSFSTNLKNQVGYFFSAQS